MGWQDPFSRRFSEESGDGGKGRRSFADDFFVGKGGERPWVMKEPQTGSGTFRFWRRGKPSCGAVATPWWCWKAPKVARCGMHCGISVWPSRPPVEVWGVADPVGCASPVRFLLPMTRNERFWVTRGWPRGIVWRVGHFSKVGWKWSAFPRRERAMGSFSRGLVDKRTGSAWNSGWLGAVWGGRGVCRKHCVRNWLAEGRRSAKFPAPRCDRRPGCGARESRGIFLR